MLKRFFFLAIIFLISACSNIANSGLGSLFGPTQPKKDRNYYNSDAYYLENDNNDIQAPRTSQREIYYTQEKNYPQRMYPRYYVEEDDYEDDDENNYNYRSPNYRAQQNGCACYDAPPSSHYSKRQLSQQKRDYYRRECNRNR